MTDNKHTATPLRSGYLGQDVIDATGTLYAKTKSKERAAHIIKCVNQHGTLIAALKEIKNFSRPPRETDHNYEVFSIKQIVRKALKEAGEI